MMMKTCNYALYATYSIGNAAYFHWFIPFNQSTSRIDLHSFL